MKRYFISFVVITSIFCLISCGDDPNPPQSQTVTDIDGNKYETMQIGDQVWMAENLNVSRFCDGSEIKYKYNYKEGMSFEFDQLWEVTDIVPARCYFNDSDSMANIYGALYNWYAVNDSKCICPEGWRIPTNIDWQILIDHLGENAGVKLKEEGYQHWMISGEVGVGGSNESGFNALPSGYRSETCWGCDDGEPGYLSVMWCKSELECAFFPNLCDVFSVGYDEPGGYFGCSSKGFGLSVRCIKE